jgi:putative tryptophan/tyrosine transport system substrate-binding protein
MKRREFISVLGGAAVWPLGARAQRSMSLVIGFVNGASLEPYAQHVKAFLAGLRESGFVEGQNVRIEYRWAEGRYDRLPDMVTDLVRRRVAVIVANTPVAPIVKAATTTIPIVFATGEDPVASGLVASLNRPGGNMTGVGITGPILLGKQLGLIHQFVPARTSIAILVNPKNPISGPSLTGAREAARALGREIRVLNASTEAEIETAFTMLAGADGLIVAPDALFIARRDHLVALATREAVPAIYPFREFTETGGLISYGASLSEQYQLVGVYTGKILAGAKPGDLPVLQPTKYVLCINLKTARKLELQLPPSLLALADEVIE